MLLEELDHRCGEGVVAISGDHVRCIGDIDIPGTGNDVKELPRALITDDIAQRPAYQQGGHLKLAGSDAEIALDLAGALAKRTRIST